MILEQKHERGEVSEDWYRDRLRMMNDYPEEDRRLHLTSDYTLLGPLRFHLQRALQRRASALGLELGLPETAAVEAPRAAGLEPAR